MRPRFKVNEHVVPGNICGSTYARTLYMNCDKWYMLPITLNVTKNIGIAVLSSQGYKKKY